MEYTIRAAKPDDLNALSALFLDYGQGLRENGLQYEINTDNIPNVLASRIKSRMFYSAVAEADGVLAGFVFCSIARVGGEYLCQGGSSVGYLNDIYVSPTARRQGLAKRLAACAEEWLKDNGVTAMELQVVSGNAPAQAFWQNRGAQAVGTFRYKRL